MSYQETMSQQEYKAFLDFTDRLAKTIEDLMRERGINVSTQQREVLKSNGQKLQGISVIFPDSNISPTIYSNALYDRSKEGVHIQQIARQAVEQLLEAQEYKIGLPDFGDLGLRRECLKLQLLSTSMNAELLETVPHYELPGDISAVPRWMMEGASILVTNQLAANVLKLTGDEVIQEALRNVQQEQVEIKTMGQVLREMMGASGLPDELFPEEDQPMYVLRTSMGDGTYGARAILNDRAMEELHEKLGDFVLIPSSIHEFLALPKDTITPDDLADMIRDVNQNVVEQGEVLGQEPLVYDGHKLELFRAAEQEQTQERHQDRKMSMTI